MLRDGNHTEPVTGAVPDRLHQFGAALPASVHEKQFFLTEHAFDLWRESPARYIQQAP